MGLSTSLPAATSRWLAIAGAALLCGSAIAESVVYEKGYRWKRAEQWTTGVQVGSTEGNPAPDSLGSSVWGYWTTSGTGLSSSRPWYADDRQLMVWDEFQNKDNPVRLRWSRDGGSEPAAGKLIISNSRTPRYEGWHHQALVTWTNPAGQNARVNLLGTARLIWGGPGQNETDYDIELAIVRFDAASGTYSSLVEGVYSRPLEAVGKNKWELEIPIDMRRIVLNAGDQIIFTTNNSYGSAAPKDAWVSFNDQLQIRFTGYALPSAALSPALEPAGSYRTLGSGLSVSPVPEPSNILLFALGLSVLTWVGRRRHG